LSQASGVPFYRQIVDQLAQQIRSGELAPGTPLPSVRDLAAHLLVSLITVRRAYTDLERARLVVLRQGAGTRVASDLRTASRAQAEAEARALLTDAVHGARRLGLPPSTIQGIVADLVTPGAEGHE
jgi:GntR family transcriptional regulator